MSQSTKNLCRYILRNPRNYPALAIISLKMILVLPLYFTASVLIWIGNRAESFQWWLGTIPPHLNINVREINSSQP